MFYLTYLDEFNLGITKDLYFYLSILLVEDYLLVLIPLSTFAFIPIELTAAI